MQEKLSITSNVKRNDGIVGCDIDSQIIVMSIDNGEYYNFNDVASAIWRLIESPTQVGEIVEQLTQDFEISADKCEQSVIPFLKKMESEGLLLIE